MQPTAILVLGAKVRAGGAPSRALERRIEVAARCAEQHPDAAIIACGGRHWSGVVEADAIARGLISRGIDEARIERERLSLTTIENLREGRARAGVLGKDACFAIVSCEWHLPRAMAVARGMRLEAIGVPAAAAKQPFFRAVSERFLRLLVPLLVVVMIACKRTAPPSVDASRSEAPGVASASAAPSTAASDFVAARIASDKRAAAGVPSALAGSADVQARRAFARALSQIGDAIAIEKLGRALSDEDPEVVAWAAYGLCVPCDVDADLAREDRQKLVRAIAARALTLDAKAMGALDPWAAMAWSLGRCGGLEASRELSAWLARPERAKAAAWALGAIATKDRGLEDDVAKALLDAARAGFDDALFPFGRGDWASRPPTPGLADVARARLIVKGPARVFAIRALGRAQGGKPDDLRTLVADPQTTEAERVEALRSLHRMGEAGDAEIAAFLTRALPTDPAKLVGDGFGALRVAVELLGERPLSATAKTSLRAMTFGAIGASTTPPVARRIATLRCLAAVALHPGKPAESEIVQCAAHDASLPQSLKSELDAIRDGARLSALDRSEITGERRDLLLRLAREASPRIRERALSMLGKHAEVDDVSDAMVKALSSKLLGVVASAAEAIAARPAVAQGLSKKSIAEALDPKSPPPDQIEAERAVDPKVLQALDGAVARPLEESDAEIKVALAGAVGALRYAKARGFVLRLCGDRVPALRKAGRDALAKIDPPGKAPPCTTIEEPGLPSPLASVMPAAKKVHLSTDVGELVLALDVRWAPIAAMRVAELAGSGFLEGTTIHRVVPGFVVQLGDPGGDGYGGAHSALRCETAPVAFEEGDVGIALAGRDTGSSQFFVMLGRAPHLDGSYAWIGKATGSWAQIAEGDVVLKARVD
ncbi:MAG: peptidylprolyl isomerase [Polyangiales bacterium]